MDGPDVLTPEETAKLLRIGRSTVYARLADRSIRSVRIGRRILVPKRALEELLAGGRQHSQEQGEQAGQGGDEDGRGRVQAR